MEPSTNPRCNFSAAILCMMCDKKVYLGVSQNRVVRLSNWIRHVKGCVQQSRGKQESQLTLTSFFGSSADVPAVDNTRTGLCCTVKSGITSVTGDLGFISDGDKVDSVCGKVGDVKSDDDTGKDKSGVNTSGELESLDTIGHQESNIKQGFQLAPPTVKK